MTIVVVGGSFKIFKELCLKQNIDIRSTPEVKVLFVNTARLAIREIDRLIYTCGWADVLPEIRDRLAEKVKGGGSIEFISCCHKPEPQTHLQ